ncbi:hypothetical protein ES288_A07G191500v1 [Gossypium darwinii]|uniref:Uncharacterized protein n=1 Tax=Gossypium darwinii TaxID=34276 RepID=A0A5D2G0K9_GOSDA|nr:hypothetical protein ES288_A07G191500v1 [Gossypium darwinii]
MAIVGTREIGLSSFPSSSSYLSWNSRATYSSFSCTLSMIIGTNSLLAVKIIYFLCIASSIQLKSFFLGIVKYIVFKLIPSRGCVTCSAVQESSTPTKLLLSISKAHLLESRVCFKKCFHLVLATAENKEEGKRPKPAAKSLPELMWEDVIPPLKTILESQHHLSQIQLSFQDNKLEGSFLKNGWPYSFWAFFPNEEPGPLKLNDGTVEPFLVDEKKITAKHVVFWVEKRLAAQGIIPVWKE